MILWPSVDLFCRKISLVAFIGCRRSLRVPDTQRATPFLRVQNTQLRDSNRSFRFALRAEADATDRLPLQTNEWGSETFPL